MQVSLTGGTGFVGGHLLSQLLEEGHTVRALVRDRKSAATTLKDIAELHPQKLRLVSGDVAEGIGLDEGVAGSDAMIHLVGIIFESGKATFDRIHVRGTENVVAAAKAAGIKRFVHMSALGARPDGRSAYQRSKYHAEKIVRGSGIPFVILRPSLIFGPGDGFVSQMVQIMKAAPFIRPVVGHGQYWFRPIYVADVARCFAASLMNEAVVGRTINLVGEEELRLEVLLEKIADCLGMHKPAIHIPMALMRLVASLFSILPIRPPVTNDQLTMLEEGSTADPKEMLQVFDVRPISFMTGLRKYLCNKPPC